MNLKLFLTWQGNCTAQPFTVHSITDVDYSARYGSVSYTGPGFSTDPLGTLTPTNYSEACANRGADRTVGSWVSVPLSKATFDAWLNGTGANNGLGLTTSQTSTAQFKRFTSANGPSGAVCDGHTCRPYLSVTYTPNIAPQIDATYPPNGYQATSLTRSCWRAATTPTPGPSRPCSTCSGCSPRAAVRRSPAALINSSSWTVPSGVLKWSNDYYSWCRPSDSWAMGPDPASITCFHPLSTPPPQPLVTSGLSRDGGGHGFDPGAGNYTTSALDAQVATVGPPLAIQRAYNSRDPRVGLALGPAGRRSSTCWWPSESPTPRRSPPS